MVSKLCWNVTDLSSMCDGRLLQHNSQSFSCGYVVIRELKSRTGVTPGDGEGKTVFTAWSGLDVLQLGKAFAHHVLVNCHVSACPSPVHYITGSK